MKALIKKIVRAWSLGLAAAFAIGLTVPWLVLFTGVRDLHRLIEISTGVGVPAFAVIDGALLIYSGGAAFTYWRKRASAGRPNN